MKKRYLIGIFVILLLSGCAGSTTDPRKGGLFSYDPDAYEQRLAERESHLAAIEKDTASQKHKSAHLKKELSLEKKKAH
jgi:PBP1b-binding outer membrane lipoprotein LpoB